MCRVEGELAVCMVAGRQGHQVGVDLSLSCFKSRVWNMHPMQVICWESNFRKQGEDLRKW